MGTIDFCKRVDVLFDEYVKKNNVKKSKFLNLKEFFSIVLDELPLDTIIYLNRVIVLLNNKITEITGGDYFINTVLIQVIGLAIDDWNENQDDLTIVEYNSFNDALLDCDGRVKNDNAELNFFEINTSSLNLDMFIIKLESEMVPDMDGEAGFTFE